MKDTKTYRSVIGRCCNPTCATPVQGLTVHHIKPLSKAGSKEFKNMIVLCENCHGGRAWHEAWRKHYYRLLVWKFTAELEIIGTGSDELLNPEYRALLLGAEHVRTGGSNIQRG